MCAVLHSLGTKGIEVCNISPDRVKPLAWQALTCATEIDAVLNTTEADSLLDPKLEDAPPRYGFEC